ncbi:MAG: zinc-dependent alcohol dehydrogenase [Ferrimicrobium sp.]
MRALVVDRRPLRFVAARLLGSRLTERAVESGPLTYRDQEPPSLPSKEWIRVRTLMAGICGSDIATVFFQSSRYFEPLTSFPFTPGHEVVVVPVEGDQTTRYVVEPALTCAVRGLAPCDACRNGSTQHCESVTIGTLDPGIQLGYCHSTGGGWSTEFIAHSQALHAIPNNLSLTDAVMIEPLACAIHAALRPTLQSGSLAIIGAGSVGLSILAAASALGNYDDITIGARYPLQRELAKELGATRVVEPSSLLARARSLHPTLRSGSYIGGGYDVVIDAIGSAATIEQAITLVRPGGEVIVAGMPHRASIDLAALWHREVRLVGTYAYGTETITAELSRRLDVGSQDATGTWHARTFALAVALSGELGLGRMVTHRYRLKDYVPAIAKAHNAGREDAIKVVFDLQQRKARNDP